MLYLSLQMQMMGILDLLMVWIRSCTPPRSLPDMPSTSSMIKQTCAVVNHPHAVHIHAYLVNLARLAMRPPPDRRVGRQLLDHIGKLSPHPALRPLVGLVSRFAGVDLHRLKPSLLAHDVRCARLADAGWAGQQDGFFAHVLGLGAPLGLGFPRDAAMQVHALPAVGGLTIARV